MSAPERASGKRHIVFVVAGLGAGGAERVISVISTAWATRGWRVTILAFDDPNDPIYHVFDPAVTIVRRGLPAGRGPLRSLLTQGRRIWAIRRRLAQMQPDVVVSFLTKINVLTLLATIGTRHRVIVSERNNPHAQRASPAWNALLVRLYPRAQAVIMQTKASISCVPIKARARMRVIHNPIFMASSSGATDLPVLTSVGRLTHQKGFDLLIAAFSAVARLHPAWTLRIWGEGEMRGALERQIADLGLAYRIDLPGTSRTPGAWVQQASAMVLSSRYEGFPNVLGEAMAAGLPVIAFDCDFGPSEMITHGIDGLLVSTGDVGAMAHALDQLMSDRTLRNRLGTAARAAASRFAPEKIIAQWDALIEDVMLR
ncbi:glycosyltransferase family 4 protein [Sphingobium sp. SCG-1]|nr:glycosyltransferase family 4 protein [Sphingobium sp. SCG-1]